MEKKRFFGLPRKLGRDEQSSLLIILSTNNNITPIFKKILKKIHNFLQYLIFFSLEFWLESVEL